jgi:serine/threonine protein kinase
MKICPNCGRCYEDGEQTCALDQSALIGSRVGDRLIAGKYRLDRRLGRGGMGAVYAATHIELERPVAIKLLLPDFLADAQALERFRREARAAARLNHLHVADTYDYGTLLDGGAYIAMELIEGDTLRARLNKIGRFPVDQAVMIARQVADGIEAAHRRGIIHRDLKPSNIMLCTNCDHQFETVAKVLDFGIAKLKEQTITGDGALTNTGMLLGTPRYMSPEQCRGEELDPRSDVYSLGIILYEMLAGQPPFDAPSATAVALKHLNEPPQPLADLRPDAPDALCGLVMQAIEKDPERRPTSSQIFAQNLRAIEESLSAERDVTITAQPLAEIERSPLDTQPMSDPLAPTIAADLGIDQSNDPATSRTGTPTVEDSLPSTDLQNAVVATTTTPPLTLPPSETLTRPAINSSARNDLSASVPAAAAVAPQLQNTSQAVGQPVSMSGAATSVRPPRALLILGLLVLVSAVAGIFWYSTRNAPTESQVSTDTPFLSPKDETTAVARVSPTTMATTTPVSSVNQNSTTQQTPAPDDETAVRGVIDDWIAATNARSIERQMAFYPSIVPRYYTQTNVSRDFVRRDKASSIVGARTVDIRIEEPNITFQDNGRTAIVTFRKYFLIVHSERSQSGTVLQEMIWTRTPQGWRISSERDLRVLN